MTGRILYLTGGLLIVVGSLARADPPRLSLPVDCAIGATCVIQQYVDHDESSGVTDYRCGSLSYDGHKGTDIRALTYYDMRRGIPVLAAADGTVTAVRDGQADVAVSEIGTDAVSGREAGNVVVIDHEDDWQTQYSHLRRGSIAVKPGQRVAAGTPLGLIGLSGASDFPHFEFSLRHDGQTVDPFTGSGPSADCREASVGLWTDTARAALKYQAGGLLTAGFAAEQPSIDNALHGDYRDTELSAESPALLFLALSWGLQKGDKEVMTIAGPDGHVIAEMTDSLPKNKAQWLRYIGKKIPGDGWPAGPYSGRYRVTRGEEPEQQVIVDVTRVVELR